MTTLTDDEIKDLLTATLHGSLPVEMQQRLMATAAECVELRAVVAAAEATAPPVGSIIFPPRCAEYPMAQEVERLRAENARLRKLPNGWPQPTFMSADDDGSLNIEWCFGKQGADDSWRVMFVWSLEDGAMAAVTRRDKQDVAEGNTRDVVALLDAALRGDP